MRTGFSHFTPLFMLVLAAIGSLTCLQTLAGEPKTQPGRLETARVREVLPDSGEVVLSLDQPHSGPSLLPYRVKDRQGLSGLQPGDRVRVEFAANANGDDEPVIVQILRMGGDDAPRPNQTPQPLQSGDPLPLAGLKLSDSEGRAFDSASLAGRPVLLSFFFTRCPQPDMCPLQSAKLAQVQAGLASYSAAGPPPLIVSVTIDPGYDQPPVLKAYAKAYQARPESWLFLTGSPVEIRKLASRCGVEFWDEDGFPKHTLSLILAGPEGRVIRLLPDHQWSAAQVLKEWLGLAPR